MSACWVPCDMCDDFVCTEHGCHVHECECPSIEWWAEIGLDPYTDPHPFPERG